MQLINRIYLTLAVQVPVRVAGGLLFELLGQSVGDPLREEVDIPIVLRCWQEQNFLVSAMHVKGTPSNLNVLGITEVLVQIELVNNIFYSDMAKLLSVVTGSLIKGYSSRIILLLGISDHKFSKQDKLERC